VEFVNKFGGNERKCSLDLFISAIGLVSVMVVIPLLIHFFTIPFDFPSSVNCPDKAVAVITTIHEGSYIKIIEDDAKLTLVPNLRYSDFALSMHNSPMYSLAVGLLPIRPGMSYFIGYNWAEGRWEDIISPTELLLQKNGWVEMCGWRESGEDEYGFFHAETIRILDSSNRYSYE
jgi:hypothetical protein